VKQAIHQFHGSSSVGDAISNGLLYTRELLRSLGFESEIYCEDVEPRLSPPIRSAATFRDSPETILLVHYSWAIRCYDWLRGLKCRKVLVYHNITPPEFFEPKSRFEQLSQQAYEQLAGLREAVEASLTPSAYNARALARLGFDQTEILPLLIDTESWAEAPCQARPASRPDEDCFHILFVGRLVEHKRQEDLLFVLARLRELMRRPVRLSLVGGSAGAGYLSRLQTICSELGLDGSVNFAGKVDDDALQQLYRGADVFLCLSEHEGFCVPLLEAMRWDVPVVAFGCAAISETVGEGGLLLEDKEPRYVAGILKTLADEPGLRRELVAAGRRNLHRFGCNKTRAHLAAFLKKRLGAVVPAVPPGSPDRGAFWRIEGPFDSSYSLAAVNRSLAHALRKCGVDVGLFSTEGPGDFEPDEQFLANDPQTRRLWQRGQQARGADVVLRNLYPPRVSGMRGATRILAGWAWEESRVPPDWVVRFNRDLDLITVVSRFVAKALVDSGVRVPVAIVGNGVDHGPATSSLPTDVPATAAFKFLHISSALPRKGIDVLLEAWGRAYSSADDVVLVLKTAPNPHNEVAAQLAELGARHPDHAPVVHIDRDLPATEISGLYEWCDVVVLPARGEGFCLPAAEALAHGRPAIVTDFGGVRDFCRSDSAWMIDYAFGKARTHFDLFGSVWAEPDLDALVCAMRKARDCSASDRRLRAAVGRARLQSHFTWEAVAQRTLHAVQWLASQPAIPSLPSVAWITTWNMRCGIASYSRHLTSGFPRGSLTVLASRVDERLSVDEPFVRRCWRQGQTDPLDELFDCIRAVGASAAVFQFNFSFFDLRAFARLLDRLRTAGVRCFVVLHSTMDVEWPDKKLSLNQIRPSLAAAHRLLVHSVRDLNTLKDMGLVENVTLFPHGSNPGRATAMEGMSERRHTIACFGYLLPHKGFAVLLQAFFRLRSRYPDLHLLMLTSLYPAPTSDQTADECRALIRANRAENAVTFMTDHKPEAEILAMLSTATAIAFPYHHTQESASGAIRLALATRRPVICTPLPIFDDVREVVHFFPGTRSEDLETGLHELLDEPSKLKSLLEKQDRWLSDHDWKNLSDRLWNMVRAAEPLDLLSLREDAADAA